MALVTIRTLTKSFQRDAQSIVIFDGLDLEFAEGSFTALMGPSGSGKSTLLNLMAGLDRPTGGTVTVAGAEVSAMSATELAGWRARHVGFVFQSYNLLPRLTALKNVVLPLLYNGQERLTDEQRRERAVAALESVGLSERMHHRPNELSGGQQQRVAIARALVNRPAIILADEPTGNLDTHSSVEIMELLSALHGQGGTIVMVTHEPDISTYAGRIIHLRDGQIASDESNGHQRTDRQTAHNPDGLAEGPTMSSS